MSLATQPPSATAQPRDSAGRFEGERLDLEAVPAILATTVGILLKDPGRTLVLAWGDLAARRAEYLVTVEVIPGCADFVRITAMGAPPTSARFIRHQWPDGSTRFYSWYCPECATRVRSLFVAGVRTNALTFKIACRWCLHLRYMAQGGGNTRKVLIRTLAALPVEEPLPRGPLVPSIITSDPRELRRFRNLSVAVGAVSGCVG